MQNCPTCQMLMEDEEQLCAACAAERSSASDRLAPGPPAPDRSLAQAVGPLPGVGVGTAVLERPVAGPIPLPESVRYRTAGGHRRVVKGVVWSVVLAAGVAALAVMAMRGEGPIAEAAVEAGLVAPPSVSVPSSWQTVSPDGVGFRASVPSGSATTDGVSAGLGPQAAGLIGVSASLGSGGSTTVVADAAQRGPAELAALDDPAAFGMLVDSMVGPLAISPSPFAPASHSGGASGDTSDLAPVASPGGIETMRRQTPVGNGRAVDVVVANDTTAVTTRARFLLADGRVHVVVTSGMDEGHRRLDEVHARVISALETTR